MKLTRRTLKLLPHLIALFLILAPASSWSASSPSGKHLLWKVQSKSATVFLLGSIHYLTKDVYPLDKVIEDSFKSANVLVVEANINNPDQLFFTKFIERAFYPGNETLKNHVSARTYGLVRNEFAKFGLPMEILERERPWFLALTLTSLELLKNGFDPNYGIDMHFLSGAGSKKVVELESLDYQVSLFSGFSEAEEESFLLYTMKDLMTFGTDSGDLLRLWKSGDAKGLESMLLKSAGDDPAIASAYNKLLFGRNKEMAVKIEQFLGTGETYFVVVGAGHLVGNRGIIELLRSKGYAADQL